MDNNARRILDAARANVARISSELEPAFAADALRRETYSEPVRNLRQAPHAPKAQSAAQEEQEIAQQRYDEWREFCRGIAAEVVGELADEAGSAAGDLQRQINELRDDLAQLRTSLDVERAARSDNVVTLPSGFLRKSRGNAS
jgi:hypothetical protein